ncbi:MAG: hypothetical protein ACPL28_07990 [bacterium]
MATIKYLILTVSLFVGLSLAVELPLDAITDLGQLIPGVSNVWTITTAGLDGKTYGGSYKTPSIGAHFFIYDSRLPWDPGNTPSNNPYDLGSAIQNPSVPSEAIIYDVATGKDGKIYGGTGYAYDVGIYDYAKVFCYDPATGSFTDIGQVVAPPGIWSITTGNKGRIYIGGANGHFVSYDPRLPWDPGTTPDNNPRDYGVAVSDENRIRCLTVGKDNYIYGGTAHNAHLFVFVPRVLLLCDVGIVSI